MNEPKGLKKRPGAGAGGVRPGAGRRANSGVFGEKTCLRRVPESMVPLLDDLLMQLKKQAIQAVEPGDVHAGVKMPFVLPDIFMPPMHLSRRAVTVFEEKVRAGFPSPAEGYTSRTIDLNEHLISNPAATIFLYAEGDSMVDAGIDDGDLLVVDRSAEAHDGDIVIAAVGSAFTVKTLRRAAQGCELHPANARAGYRVIRPMPDEEVRLIGVVRWIIKKT